MCKPWLIPFLVVLALVTAYPAWALEPSSTGVILLHGKWGASRDKSTKPMADALASAGFLVSCPEMPWSGQRSFDRDYNEAMDEIDTAAQQLGERGAKSIVVMGQSLGGNAALKYATLERPLTAVVLLAPAHFPEGSRAVELVKDSIAKARAMVSEGKNGETAQFLSLNSGGRTRWLEPTAANYLSYYAPDGAAAMSGFAEKVKPIPLLWIAGSQDPATATFAELVWPKLALSPSSVRMDVPSDHMETPAAGRSVAIEWLKALTP